VIGDPMRIRLLDLLREDELSIAAGGDVVLRRRHREPVHLVQVRVRLGDRPD
jgi:hypothetical protein